MLSTPQLDAAILLQRLVKELMLGQVRNQRMFRAEWNRAARVLNGRVPRFHYVRGKL